MEIKNIDFTTKPKGYKLCFSDKCLLAEKCLRCIAVAQIDDSVDVFHVVNHFKYDDKNCKYFADNERVEIAYGMKGAFENILVSDAEEIRNNLIEHFGRTEYYRRKNGVKAIPPEEQTYIESVFSKYGYTINFDKTIENTYWGK